MDIILILNILLAVAIIAYVVFSGIQNAKGFSRAKLAKIKLEELKKKMSELEEKIVRDKAEFNKSIDKMFEGIKHVTR